MQEASHSIELVIEMDLVRDLDGKQEEDFGSVEM
jgi:hypothetical protein